MYFIADENGIEYFLYQSGEKKPCNVKWKDIKYISKTSLFAKETSDRLSSLSDNIVKNIDPQEVEEMESIASMKDIKGIFIGILDDEIKVPCRTKDIDKLYSKLKKMWEFFK